METPNGGRKPAGLLRTGIVLIVGGIILAVAPMAVVLAAFGFGAALGCTVHEGYANACVVAGIDIGGLLANAFVLGWLTFVTAPAGLMVALLGAILAAASIVRRRTSAPSPCGDDA